MSAKRRPANAKTQKCGPPKSGAFKQQKKIEPTAFRLFYKRGDIPVAYDSDARGGKLLWRKELETIDLHHFLPLFFDGLRETEQPYAMIANLGVHDMLNHGGGHRILQVVPQLIIPLKKGLDTKIPQVMCRIMKAMQSLVVAGPHIGEALVPYYRQLLPVLNQFKMYNVNSGDMIDYSQHKRENIGDLVEETLQLFEKHGGEDAFINIKYMVPTYESCVMN